MISNRLFGKTIVVTLIFILFSVVESMGQESVSALSIKEVELIKRYCKAVESPNVVTYLFSDLQKVRVGGKMKVGVLFEIKQGMNIYGPEKASDHLPTVLEWVLSNGLELERIAWQPVSSLPNGKKGYMDFCFVMAELSVDSEIEEPWSTVRLKTSFQVCDERYCISGETENVLKVPFGKDKKSTVAKIFKNK